MINLYIGWMKLDKKEDWQRFYQRGLEYIKNKYNFQPEVLEINPEENNKINTDLKLILNKIVPKNHIYFRVIDNKLNIMSHGIG